MAAVSDGSPSSGSHGEAGPATRTWWPGWPLTALIVVLALLPLVASVVAVAPGWVPVGDDATIEMRGRDLFTGDTPLLGMPSAVGEQTGRRVHHPGPLELWWVGLWVRGWGISQASLAAATAVWAVATTTALLLARRIGGPFLLGLAGVVLALLTWSLRGEVPVTPFNAHVIVVPLAAYLLALVAWHQRVRGAGLAALVLGSWSAQAHLTAVGPVVSAGVVVAGMVVLRRRRSPQRPDLRWRSLAFGAGALALCWLGPVIDVLTNEGGNLRAVLGARGDLASEAIGPGAAADITVRALSWRPVWASAGAHPSELVLAAGPQHWASAGLVVVVAVVGALRRRRTHPGLGVAVVASCAGIVTGALLAARFPGEYLSLLALHNHLWLWPLTAFLWGAALVAVGLEVGDLVRARYGWARRVRTAAAVALFGLALVAVGAASLGEPHRNLTLAEPAYVRALGEGAQVRLDPDATYRVTISGEFDRFFVEVGLLAYLERAGFDVVGPPRYRDTFGDHRTTVRRPVAGDLVVDLGWEAVEVATGPGRALAEHRPSAALLALRREVEDRLVALLRRTPGALPLHGMASTDDAEIRRWLREDLDGLVLAGFVPESLAGAAETQRYLDLWREPVLHASVRLVPTNG